jgi:FAD synthase
VEEELVVYDTSFEKDLSPFQIPSSPELDKKWDNLYNCELVVGFDFNFGFGGEQKL